MPTSPILLYVTSYILNYLLILSWTIDKTMKGKKRIKIYKAPTIIHENKKKNEDEK